MTRSTLLRATRLAATALALAALQACGASPPPPPLDMSGPVARWPGYGGSSHGLAWSPLDQIDSRNVKFLKPAWVHHSGDISNGKGAYSKTSMETEAIVPNDTLYYCSGFDKIYALDPETGKERWQFDPHLRDKKLSGPYPMVCRGVSYWKGKDSSVAGACHERIFIGTLDSQLIAVDAKTGKPCADFGHDGRVDLRKGIEKAPPWEYYVTSPPLVMDDTVVIGALIQDNLRVHAPAGVVRAYDARTGALRWAFDPVPPGWDATHPKGPGSLSYTPGTPNVWSIISGDPQRGLVFVPTGNPSPDLYDAVRDGLTYYGSSVVALSVKTGKVVWHFQTVHHDVWDYDVPAQPALFQIPGVGGGVPGVAQITKMGFLFLLNRDTGVPLYPVEERPVPKSDVPGEHLSPTQPFPTHPGPLAPTKLPPSEAFGFTPLDRHDCREKLSKHRNLGIFTPPSLEGSIQYPGNAGGPNWGGISIDPVRGVAFVNQMRAPALVQLIPRAQFEKLDPSKVVYPEELYPMKGAPYGVRRGPVLSMFGAPCVPPPWGTISAVDLKSGKVLWQSVLGTTRDQAPWPLWFHTGAPNLGGTLATAGGLVFVGATTDKYFRAFDARTGKEIWTYRIPYTANSTPMTYRLHKDGRQFVVIAAGGHGWSQSGDALMAFALPEPKH